MIRYGITWWGGQWLNALAHIDYSNRLPRGRSYANKGAVKEISIQKNVISARVSGTRATPYKVKLKIPEFSGEEIATLTGEILKNPLLISRLLNRELPRSLNELAKSQMIRIFPERWDDLDMHCSCPDWAIPCKHLAAVINLVANEIDKNPFLIFKLHGFDIISELKKAGLESIEESILIPELQTLMIPGAPSAPGKGSASPAGITPGKRVKGYTEYDKSGITATSREPEKNERAVPSTPWGTEMLLDSFDLSEVPAMRDNLLAMFDGPSLFYRTDFKTILDKIYRKTSRFASRELIGAFDQEQQPEIYFEKYEQAEIRIRHLIYHSGSTISAGAQSLQITTIRELAEFIQTIPPKYLDRLHDHLLLLYFIYHFTLKLAEQSALVPQLVLLPDDTYAIRWIPALMNETIGTLHARLSASCPPDLVAQEVPEGAPADTKADTSLLKKEQVNALVSLFFKQIIEDCGIQDNLPDDPVPMMFSSHYSRRFDAMGEQEVPGAIHRWLEKFHIIHGNFTPGFRVSPGAKGETFRLEVFVENKKEALSHSIPLEEFLQDPEHAHEKFEVLRSLEMLTGTYRGLEQIIATSGRYVPAYSSHEFAEMMFRILPLIRLYGIPVILPGN